MESRRAVLRCILRTLVVAAAVSPVLAATVVTGGVSLDDNNFSTAVGDSTVWVVKFHSPRCGTCQEFEPIWNKFSAAVAPKAKFGIVDIEEKAGMKLAKELGVLEDDGIPSVRVFKEPGDREGSKLWSGWEVPRAGFLLSQLENTLEGHMHNGHYVKLRVAHEAEDL